MIRSKGPTRRSLIQTVLAAPLILTAARGFAQTAEEDEIARLYEAAQKEEGALTIYGGGDRDSQADAPRKAFNKAFPELDLKIIVDYSKFHDARLDYQLARGDVTPDIIQLQTVQNFPRWAEMDVLERFKPAGFDAIYDPFKDPEGAWMAVLPLAFSYMYDVAGVGDTAPRSPEELIDPRWKGQIASSYPHDDDAVLFLYKKYIDVYGWGWFEKLVTQDMAFARGSYTPSEAVQNGEKLIGIGGSGTATATDAPMRWVLPEDGPFMGWGQRAAILKTTPRPNMAKLYMAWSVSQQVQSANYNGWSVRTDTPVPEGLKPLWEYDNAYVDEFPEFMADREGIEQWKRIFALFFGRVQGEPTPGNLGPRPT